MAAPISQMALGKRDRELDESGGDSSNPAVLSSDEINLQQQPSSAKRSRKPEIGMGSTMGAIVDKANQTTASMLRESSSETESKAEGNVDLLEASQPVGTRPPIDVSSTGESAAMAASPEEVPRPNQNPNDNQESRGPVFKLSAEAVGEDAVVAGDGAGQAAQEVSDCPEKVLNSNRNEIQEDFRRPSEGPVEEEAEEASTAISGPTEEVLNLNQNQEELYGLLEHPLPEKTGGAEQCAPQDSDAAEEVLNPNLNENQGTRSLSEGSVEVDAGQAAEDKSEESRDLIELPSSEEAGEEKDVGEGPGQAVQELSGAPGKVLNPNQDLNPEKVSLSSMGARGEADEVMYDALGKIPTLNPNQEESQRLTEHFSSAKSGKEMREVFYGAIDYEELEPPESVSTNSAQASDQLSRFGGGSSLSGGWQMESIVNHGPYGVASVATATRVLVSETRAGPQVDHFRLTDRDGLMHILGFLRTPDLARFCGSFTGARDVVSSHATLEIMKRFPLIRVGVRDPPLSDMSQRRLTFGSLTVDPAARVSSSGKNYPVGVLERPNHASHHFHAAHQQQAMFSQEVSDDNVGSSSTASMSVRGSRFSRRLAANARGGLVGVGVDGNGGGLGGGGSSMADLERCKKGVGLVKCEGRNLEHAFPSLHYLEEFGNLLMSQQKTLPSLDMFETQWRNTGFGPNEFLTPRIRAEHVDRMVEVALRFKLSTVALHAAVSALDVCLGNVAVPRNRLKMLAAVCIMIQSQESEETRAMTTSDVRFICARQFNASQVHSTYNIVVSHTQEATSHAVPATAAEILNRLLVSVGEESGLTRPLGRFWEKKGVPVKEENILAILMIDLAMLDEYMFRFRPSTLAAAALFFASITAVYYSKRVEQEECGLIMKVLGPGCRPFIPLNPCLERRPFRDRGLSHFIPSQPCEAGAVRMCVERLWLLHRDFVNQISNKPSSNPSLQGIKSKFFISGSTRLEAYRGLGLVPKPLLESMLDKHLPSMATPYDPFDFHGIIGGVSTSTPAAATAGAGSGGSSSAF